MKKTPSIPGRPGDLRRLAEQRLRKQPVPEAKNEPLADPQRLLQELQIHQIELEMQNEELKQSKVEVEAGLEKYTDLYDFAPAGYFNLARDGTIQLVNLTGAALVGVERSRLVGRSLGHLILTESRPAFHFFLKTVFEGETGQSGDFVLLSEARTRLTVNIEARRLPSGRECRAVVMDITARKQAEEKVLVSEIRYRRLFEAAQDGVLLVDPATRKITDANPFMTKLLGYAHDELAGRELFEIGLLKDEAASREMFRKLKKTHQVRYENLPLKSKTGRLQQVEVVANLYEENGHPVIQCNVRDITKRKQAEDILRRNEALFSALIEQAPVGVYVVDAAFCLQQVNPRAQPVFVNVYPLIGRDFSEVLHLLWPRRVSDQVVARFRHTLKTGEPYLSPEFAERRRDTHAQEIYEWQIQRITLPGGEYGVVAFFNNITGRKRAEETQRRLEVQTASNEKLKQEIVRRQAVESALTESEQHAQGLLGESRDLQKKLRRMSHQNLLAQENQRKEISHELHDKISQVLIGINVQLEIFTKKANINPKTIAPVRRLVKHSVQVVHEFARRLRPSLLDDLGLIPALRVYIETLPLRQSRRIQFTAFDGAEGLDNDKRTVLFRVAQEALVNVAKHARARVVKVLLLKKKGGVCLEVIDDGKAFDVDRLSSAQWSHRLGLTGMRERVEMAGGRFSVESSPGKGTSIRAEVPFGRNSKRT